MDAIEQTVNEMMQDRNYVLRNTKGSTNVYDKGDVSLYVHYLNDELPVSVKLFNDKMKKNG